MYKPFLPLVALMAAAPITAQGPVDLPDFDSISLRGEGRLTVRHGAEQQVTLVKGSRETTRFTVDRKGQLRVETCIRPCPDYELELEIVMPDLNAVSVEGGGTIRAEGRFPDQGQLAVAINRGGLIDVLPIETGRIAASVNQSGVIRAHARSSLVASINGGGAISYRGSPSVTSAVQGGGIVSALPD